MTAPIYFENVYMTRRDLTRSSPFSSNCTSALSEISRCAIRSRAWRVTLIGRSNRSECIPLPFCPSSGGQIPERFGHCQRPIAQGQESYTQRGPPSSRKPRSGYPGCLVSGRPSPVEIPALRFATAGVTVHVPWLRACRRPALWPIGQSSAPSRRGLRSYNPWWPWTCRGRAFSAIGALDRSDRTSAVRAPAGQNPWLCGA